jgi:M6 family metalloprotease-like protein
MSVPFTDKTLRVQQPDGRTLTVRASGSHRAIVLETPDGRPVAQDARTGEFRVDAGPAAAPRAAAAPREADAAPSALAPALNKPRWQERRDAQRAQLLRRSRGPVGATEVMPAPPQRGTVGDFIGLCLLIDFPDAPGTIAQSDVDAFCNQAGYDGFGNHGSVADYFRDISQGRLEYRTIVAPYYTAQQPRGFYTDPAIPYPHRAKQLIDEALVFHRDAGFDFSGPTVDNSGSVYATNVLYAGPAEAVWSKGLWPHASQLDAPFQLSPGKSAADYQITHMGERLALGVYCHENGHMLCDFPDLYLYANSRVGVGRYCLMCLGANPDPHNPTQVSAYLRFRAGWGEAAPITAGEQQLAPASSNAFLIHRKNETEYFLFENRRNRDRDAELASSGLAVWHIDELGSNSNPRASPDGHQHAECVLLQTDGLDELGRGIDDGDARDLFGPAPGPVFIEGTPRSARWWDGSDSGLQIHSIQAVGEDLSFVVELV